MTEQIVVLGWDGLDIELIEEFGLGGRFGMHQTKIETFCNPVIEKPHTMEVWPSLITGVPPSEHGVVAVDESDGVEWDNPLLDMAAPVARALLPQATVSWIGARLRENGANLDARTPDHYHTQGVGTVFDDVGGRAVSIPNYQTEFDTRHSLDANRDSTWAALDVDRSPENAVRPQIDTAAVYDILGREVGQRIGHTIAAMQAGEPLVWTWFGVLDSVGHMNPAVDAHLQRHWHIVAANITETVTELAGPETIVISLSDHGIQDGKHTEYATLCTDDPSAGKSINSVLDVADWIRDGGPTGYTPTGGAEDTPTDVQERLERLGYI